jgi:hypothetical protein
VITRHWIFCAVLLSAGTFAACGGSTTSVTPSSVAPVPAYPIDGATYSYASKSWGIAYPAAPATPFPFPTGFGTQDETVHTGATFDGRSDLIDVRTVYRGPSEVETSDEYLQWVPIAGRRALELIAQASRAKGQTNNGAGQTQYSVPAAEVQVPFTAGNAWNGAIAYHATGSGVFVAGGVSMKTHSDETWNQDGSYARSGLNVGLIWVGHNISTTQQVDGDGSASSSSAEDRNPPVKTIIGVPKQDATGSYVIPIVDILGKKANIPDWYPGGALPPAPLVRVNVVDRGMEKLPAGCDVPRSLATMGEAIVRTASQFDPNGIVATRTGVAYYAPGIGMVCDMQSERDSVYFVIAPAALFGAREVFYTTTSLARLTRKPGSARTQDFADALAYAAGAALSDTTRRRVHATIQAALRPYVKR